MYLWKIPDFGETMLVFHLKNCQKNNSYPFSNHFMIQRYRITPLQLFVIWHFLIVILLRNSHYFFIYLTIRWTKLRFSNLLKVRWGGLLSEETEVRFEHLCTWGHWKCSCYYTLRYYCSIDPKKDLCYMKKIFFCS